MNVRPLLLLGLLCTTTAFAQGTFLYTWHGNSGYFQASFQISASENQPGQYFEHGTFKATFMVVSPDDSYPAAGGYFSGDDVSHFNSNMILDISVTMTDPTSGREVLIGGNGDDPKYPPFYGISECLLSNPSVELWWESGYWTSTPVPEPSALSLASLGAVLWCARTRFLSGPRHNVSKQYLRGAVTANW